MLLTKDLKYLMLLFCLGLIFLSGREVFGQDCIAPNVQNGDFTGQVVEGINAAVLCHAGYEGGGTAKCNAGAWTPEFLPCSAIDCGPRDVAHGALNGATTFGGTATVDCENGYEGGGTAECGTNGNWDTVPECTAVRCPDPDVDEGHLDGDDHYSGSAEIVCNTGYEGGGSLTCQADGNWDDVPLCFPKDCGTPTIPHGSLAGGSFTTYGGIATVNCNAGYIGGGIATCQDDATWVLPSCDPKDCGIPAIANGSLTDSSSTKFDGLATVECEIGYVGGGIAFCQNDGTWATLPTCDPKDCGTPIILHGGLSTTSSTLYTEEATVECSEGYEGGGTATCLNTGSWDTLPKCSPKDCGTPNIDNGGLTAISTTLFDGTAAVECDAGYQGGGAAVCQDTGLWGQLPTCDPKDCGDPGVGNSQLHGDTFFIDGDEVTIVCDPGYDGGDQATCLSTGSWKTPLPSCAPKDCGPPPIQHGNLKAGSTTVFDGSATVECNNGYEGGGAATCQSDATWAPLPPCTPVDCGTPSIPYGYLAVGSETFFSGTAAVACDPGYELDGSDTATCLANRNWDTFPVCNPKDCGPLTNPVHGTVSAPITIYTSVATYTCESLWQLNGSSTRTCEADGEWAPDPPTCDDIDCPDLTQPNNGGISTTKVQVGTSVIVSCDASYTLFGDELIQCETGGTWNTTVGICKKDCTVLSNPLNGILSTDVIIEGTVVNVSCDTAYTLEGANQLTCSAGGSWDNNLPDCTEDCQPLVVPTNGNISTPVQSQGTVVSVTCYTGYTLFGDSTLTCLTNASWDSPEPKCELDCPKLSNPLNGKIDNTASSQDTVVSYSCNNGYSLFGAAELTCKSDSKWDFTAPVCKQDCPTLTHPDNGILSTLEPRQTTVTNASCDPDYTLFGATTLTCQSDATWNFPLPKCRKDCPALTAPVDGNISSAEVRQETTVTVTCDTAYTLFGASLLICQGDATWDNPVPDCRQDCPALSHPSDGILNNTEIRSQGTVIGITCHNTYTLFGASELTCQNDATWDDTLPECKKDCPILTAPMNGNINTSFESQGTFVGIACDTGYTLFGASTLFCETDASWDLPIPVCKKDCRQLNEPLSGSIDDDSAVSQDTIVVFSCDPGFTLFGSDTLICQDDASWNGTEPSCEKDCPVLNILHGKTSTSTVIMTTVVHVTCDQDYSLEGEATLTCITNGAWNYPEPLCTKDCRDLVPPTNGHIDTTSVSQDTAVNVSCDFNYTLFGASVLTCLDNSKWDFPEPSCKLDCPVLDLPANAIFSTLDKYEGATVTISCETDFTRFGNDQTTCLPGGFWDRSLPVCKRDCPDLSIPVDGSLNTSEVKEGTAVTVSCNPGYTLLGNSILSCLPGGEWDLYPPVCDRECGILTNPIHGLVTFSDGTTLNKVAAYACNTGYDLSHTTNRVCQSNGIWSSPEPTCIIRDCGEIPVPLNGGVTYSNKSTTFREIATFTCDPGYILTGAKKRLCLSDKTWSGTSPTCIVKDCGSLTSPALGTVNTGSGTTFGQIAKYYCFAGYTLVGDNERRCDENGQWDRSPPICEIKDCGNLTSPSNGSVSFSSTTYNSVAYYSCHSGYDLVGTSSTVCRSDGIWSSTPPVCGIKDCGVLFNPVKGSVSYSNSATTYQEVATYVCDVGYTLTGNVNRTCLADGKWGGTSPTCGLQDCGSLSNPTYGSVNTGGGTTFGKKASYFCNFGYTINGVLERICESNGQWSDTPPVCDIKDCGELTNPVNGVVSVTKTTYNEIASYTCDPGYGLIGVSQRVCKEDKTWSNSAPVCQLKDCGLPLVIPHGNVTLPAGTEYNTTAIYTCDISYGLVGNEAVLCLSSGYWDIPPVCSLDCGLPTELPNGNYLIQTDTLTGSMATYSCNDGYNLVGEPDVTCQTSGAWESPPTCQIIPMDMNATCYVTEQCVTTRATCRSDGLGATRCLCAKKGEVYDSILDSCLSYCGFLTAPTNGYIVLPTEPSENQIVTYSCGPGFALSNITNTNRTCLDNGQWSGSAPLCLTGCPEPLEINNGVRTTPDGRAAGKFVHYRCNDGYALDGEAFRECLTDTTWNGNEPKCSKECEDLGPIKNGVVDLSGGRHESTIATYYCDKDYALVGTATRQCTSTATWSGTAPDCIYAIFPDVLLVIGSLLIFLVIIDVCVVLVLIYIKYNKKKTNNPQKVNFDDLDEPQTSEKYPVSDVPPVERPEPGVPPMSFIDPGPGRASFRKPQDDKEPIVKPAIPQIPRKSEVLKQKRSLLQRIPKPKPLQRGLNKKGKRPKFYGPETPFTLQATPRTQMSALDEFADVKISEMENYLKEDQGTPSSSDINRRSTADEEKVSIDHITSSRLPTGDKMVLMDFDAQDEVPATRLEELPKPFKSGSPIHKSLGDFGWDNEKERGDYTIDTLRPHTPIFPHQRQSDV